MIIHGLFRLRNSGRFSWAFEKGICGHCDDQLSRPDIDNGTPGPLQMRCQVMSSYVKFSSLPIWLVQSMFSLTHVSDASLML